MTADRNPFARTPKGFRNTAARLGLTTKQRRKAKPLPRPRPRGVADLMPVIDKMIGEPEPNARVVLHYPPVELSPNWRGRWDAIKAKKVYRHACWADAKAFGLRLPPGAIDDPNIGLRLDFFPPDRRERDDDNAPASFKAGRDGVADALGIDDKRFQTTCVMHTEPRSCVVVTLYRLDAGSAEALA